MSITIAVYNPSYSKIIERIGNFNTAQDAAHYRDHSSLAYQPTKLEQLGRRDEYTPAESFNDVSVPVQASEQVDYSYAEANGWVHTSEGWLME